MTVNSVSIKDVALRAGVSLGTVSNVLNSPSKVSQTTRKRVEQAIDELGYVRHESARHLRAGHSRTLAYVVLDASNPFFTDVARGAQQVAEQAGLGLFLCNSNQDPTVEHHYLDLLAEQRVRGVLITPIDPDGKALSHLTRRGIPLVMVDRAASVADRAAVGSSITITVASVDSALTISTSCWSAMDSPAARRSGSR